MSKLLFKYNIKSRGTEGNNNTWSIEDMDSGEVVLIDHIELKTPVSTVEKNIEGHSFGMITWGEIEYRNYPNSDKQFIVIVPES